MLLTMALIGGYLMITSLLLITIHCESHLKNAVLLLTHTASSQQN